MTENKASKRISAWRKQHKERIVIEADKSDNLKQRVRAVSEERNLSPTKYMLNAIKKQLEEDEYIDSFKPFKNRKGENK